MLFRVGLVTILLFAVYIIELTRPAESPPLRLRLQVQSALLLLILCTYGLTLIYAIALPYIKRVDRFAAIQVAIDLLGISVLVLLTGAPESMFGFAYLLAIVGASMVLSLRGALMATAAAFTLYVGVSLLWLSGLGNVEETVIPLSNLLRPILVNGVAMLATAALATRLTSELQRASERIASQHSSLRDLATLHREVIQSLQSGLISVDLSGHVATFNAAAGEILGVPAEDAIGRHVSVLLPGIEEYLNSADLGAIVARMELRLHPPGGADASERIIGVTISRLLDHREQMVGRLIHFQDLTVLRRAEDAAKQADRLAVIGRMAATVAHELRNPLAAICGSIELLARMMPQTVEGEARDLMQIVVREGSRLDALITELLSYASPRPLDRVGTDLAQAIEQMVQVFEHDKRLGKAQIVTLRADPASVLVDVNRLRQVIWNVLRNAAEANPGGRIEISVIAEQGHAKLIVRDHGPGISDEVRTHLFEPFFTTKQTGTGLGLATAHRIIEEHEGEIEMHNAAPGPGAEIIITLPIQKENERFLPDPAEREGRAPSAEVLSASH